MNTKPQNNALIHKTRHAVSIGAAIAALAAWAPSLQASTLYWDTNGANNNVGGTGTWSDQGDSNWNPLAAGTGTPQAWNNTATPVDTARFAGTAGTVTISGTVITNLADFQVSGYRLTGGTLQINSAGNTTILGISASGSPAGTTIIDTPIELKATGAGNSQYVFLNGGTTNNTNLTINGNITVTTTSASEISLRSPSSGTTTLAASINSATGSTGSLSLGIGRTATGATSSSAVYIISGSNNLTNNTRASLSSGTTLVQNADAFGTTNASSLVRLGNSDTVATSSPSLLLDGALTLASNIFLDRGTVATRTLGGNTAQNSEFSGTIDFWNSSSSVQVSAVSGGRVDFSGQIKDGTGSSSITKIGAGTVRFTYAAGNAYDGGTTVNAGTLLVNNTSGSGLGTGAVTVAAGATLGGSGSIAGATTINGIVAPGDGGLGTLTINNDATWNGAASADSSTDWKFELGVSNTSDLLAILGAGSDFLKGTGSVFRFDFLNSAEAGTYVLANWAGTTNFSASDFSYTNLGGGHTGSFSINNSQLEFTVVPEPQTWIFAISGIALLVYRNRFRQVQS